MRVVHQVNTKQNILYQLTHRLSVCHFTEFHFVPAQLQLDQARYMLLTESILTRIKITRIIGIIYAMTCKPHLLASNYLEPF